MQATFNNRLVVVEPFPGTKAPRKVRYQHTYRVDIEVYIQPRSFSHEKVNDNISSRDWDIALRSKNEELEKRMRAELAADFISYVKRRLRTKDSAALTFEDIEKMAKMWSIK